MACENHIANLLFVNIPMNLCTGSQGRVFKASKATATLPGGDIRAICLAKESHCKTPVHAASTWSPCIEVKIIQIMYYPPSLSSRHSSGSSCPPILLLSHWIQEVTLRLVVLLGSIVLQLSVPHLKEENWY